MSSTSIGSAQRHAFAPAIMIHSSENTGLAYQYSTAMDIDGHPQSKHSSAEDRFIKRQREQRKLNVQIDSRQALLDKIHEATKLREQRATNRIGENEFKQAMEALKKLKIRY